MIFIRKSKSRETTSYQLVRSYRENGKVKTKVLVHLGEHPTVEEAIADWSEQIGKLKAIGRENKAERLQSKLVTLKGLQDQS